MIPGAPTEPTHTNAEVIEVLERLEGIVSAKAALSDQTTNPGLVVTTKPLPLELYWSAVRGVVKLSDIKKKLTALGALHRGFKKGRGIIGASAAISWSSQPANDFKHQAPVNTTSKLDHTYELITYRSENFWGTARVVSAEAVRELDRKFPSTFNNYDYENEHIAITPNSPCPVLFGVRGESVAELHGVLEFLTNHENTEPVNKWLIFYTNQGTDDHLIPTIIPELTSYSSVIVTGRVSQKPYSITGGHVFIKLEEPIPEASGIQQQLPKQNPDKAGPDQTEHRLILPKITCAAYEPTKGFRNIVRSLLPGDIIRVYGGVRSEPKTINIEKLAIDRLMENRVKLHNPRCPRCGRSMKSIGYNKGYRCRKCHELVRSEAVPLALVHRPLEPGFYEVPVAARRHLAKPLKRM
ncbi:TiaS agmantine-binding domain-containing protein [[Eubacterium] cellulosolvens]